MEVDKYRLAQYFLIIGIVLLVVFFATDQSQNPQFGLFFMGALVTSLGAYLMAKSYRPPPPSTRFNLIKRLFGGHSQPEPEKKKPEPQKSAPKRKWFGFGKKSNQ